MHFTYYQTMKFEALNQYAKQTVDSRLGHQKEKSHDSVAFIFVFFILQYSLIAVGRGLAPAEWLPKK